MSRTWVLYMHKNKTNGKVYIGITCQSDDPNKRWQNGKHYESNKHFTSAIKKYGWDGFEHIILKEGIQTEAEATTLEKEVIEKYNATDREHGYNVLEGGKGYHSGYKMTPEHKRHMMESIEKFKTDPAYADWLREHTELARKHAKEMWANNREELMAKMEKTRQENYFRGMNSPVCKVRISKGSYWGYGEPYIANVYPSINSASTELEERETVLRECKRSYNKIRKNELLDSEYFKTTHWIFVKDAISVFKSFNPILKYNIETCLVEKIYLDENKINSGSRKRILTNIEEQTVVNKKYIWFKYSDFISSILVMSTPAFML